jgi:DNA-binding MurR/RpiR family transcriptional regulator
LKSLRDLLAYYNTECERDSNYAVIEYLLEHVRELNALSMGDVARHAYVSKSTVSRLIRRFGFESYNDFLENANRYVAQDFTVTLQVTPQEQRLLKDRPQAYLDAYLDEVCASLLQLKETVDVAEVDQIIELARLRTTAIFATDKPLTLARDLQRGFLAQGRLIHVGETKRKRQQIALGLSEGDFALVLTNYGRYVEGNRAMFEDLRRRGIETWLITLEYDGPNTLLFDHVTRLSKNTHTAADTYPMRAFVEFLIRRLLVSAP